ncbi:HD domain-containing protein [Rickettsia endosymbiont of Halotydeus destructor]|uniref:HD domain-containing protein n=1 Tax=Rickettsia endosymbiont of Halotydeus destructor TaxID=2996754 RepID=UPI003BAF3D9F
MKEESEADNYYAKELFNKLTKKNEIAKSKIDLIEIEKAIYFAKKSHGEQKRHSGEPYYSHPMEVASMVSDYLFDTDTIIAAILHDVVEDTSSSLKQIELLFNKKIAEIVDIVTKLTTGHQLSKEETFYKINNFPDIERKACTIKVIDRLHNMRTITNIKPIEKQRRIAKETLDVYISMAKRANLPKVEKELAEIATKVYEA